ncbi:hypothetical protein GCM10029978_004190 [Actinoallomurus acanthiterrae]
MAAYFYQELAAGRGGCRVAESVGDQLAGHEDRIIEGWKICEEEGDELAGRASVLR